jgi:hypothetical protein
LRTDLSSPRPSEILLILRCLALLPSYILSFIVVSTECLVYTAYTKDAALATATIRRILHDYGTADIGSSWFCLNSRWHFAQFQEGEKKTVILCLQDWHTYKLQDDKIAPYTRSHLGSTSDLYLCSISLPHSLPKTFCHTILFPASADPITRFSSPITHIHHVLTIHVLIALPSTFTIPHLRYCGCMLRPARVRMTRAFHSTCRRRI